MSVLAPIRVPCLVFLLHAAGACGSVPHSDDNKFDEKYLLAQEELQLLEGIIEGFREDKGRFPATLAELATPDEAGLIYVRGNRGFVDPWGNPYYYKPLKVGEKPQLLSLGADGIIGGTGTGKDIYVEEGS